MRETRLEGKRSDTRDYFVSKDIYIYNNWKNVDCCQGNVLKCCVFKIVCYASFTYSKYPTRIVLLIDSFSLVPGGFLETRVLKAAHKKILLKSCTLCNMSTVTKCN